LLCFPAESTTREQFAVAISALLDKGCNKKQISVDFEKIYSAVKLVWLGSAADSEHRETFEGPSNSSVAGLVFKQVVRGNPGSLSLDGQALNVLMSLDGKKDLGQIGLELNIDLVAIRPIIAKLHYFKLIEKVIITPNVVDQNFLSYLISQLSVAVGPLGKVIVEDELDDLGFHRKNFPAHRAAELINLLSQEIHREDKRIEFKQAMLKKIKEKEY